MTSPSNLNPNAKPFNPTSYTINAKKAACEASPLTKAELSCLSVMQDPADRAIACLSKYKITSEKGVLCSGAQEKSRSYFRLLKTDQKSIEDNLALLSLENGNTIPVFLSSLIRFFTQKIPNIKIPNVKIPNVYIVLSGYGIYRILDFFIIRRFMVQFGLQEKDLCLLKKLHERNTCHGELKIQIFVPSNIEGISYYLNSCSTFKDRFFLTTAFEAEGAKAKFSEFTPFPCLKLKNPPSNTTIEILEMKNKTLQIERSPFQLEMTKHFREISSKKWAFEFQCKSSQDEHPLLSLYKHLTDQACTHANYSGNWLDLLFMYSENIRNGTPDGLKNAFYQKYHHLDYKAIIGEIEGKFSSVQDPVLASVFLFNLTYFLNKGIGTSLFNQKLCEIWKTIENNESEILTGIRDLFTGSMLPFADCFTLLEFSFGILGFGTKNRDGISACISLHESNIIYRVLLKKNGKNALLLNWHPEKTLKQLCMIKEKVPSILLARLLSSLRLPKINTFNMLSLTLKEQLKTTQELDDLVDYLFSKAEPVLAVSAIHLALVSSQISQKAPNILKIVDCIRNIALRQETQLLKEILAVLCEAVRENSFFDSLMASLKKNDSLSKVFKKIAAFYQNHQNYTEAVKFIIHVHQHGLLKENDPLLDTLASIIQLQAESDIEKAFHLAGKVFDKDPIDNKNKTKLHLLANSSALALYTGLAVKCLSFENPSVESLICLSAFFCRIAGYRNSTCEEHKEQLDRLYLKLLAHLSKNKLHLEMEDTLLIAKKHHWVNSAHQAQHSISGYYIDMYSSKPEGSGIHYFTDELSYSSSFSDFDLQKKYLHFLLERKNWPHAISLWRCMVEFTLTKARSHGDKIYEMNEMPTLTAAICDAMQKEKSTIKFQVELLLDPMFSLVFNKKPKRKAKILLNFLFSNYNIVDKYPFEEFCELLYHTVSLSPVLSRIGLKTLAWLLCAISSNDVLSKPFNEKSLSSLPDFIHILAKNGLSHQINTILRAFKAYFLQDSKAGFKSTSFLRELLESDSQNIDSATVLEILLECNHQDTSSLEDRLAIFKTIRVKDLSNSQNVFPLCKKVHEIFHSVMENEVEEFLFESARLLIANCKLDEAQALLTICKPQSQDRCQKLSLLWIDLVVAYAIEKKNPAILKILFDHKNLLTCYVKEKAEIACHQSLSAILKEEKLTLSQANLGLSLIRLYIVNDTKLILSAFQRMFLFKDKKINQSIWATLKNLKKANIVPSDYPCYLSCWEEGLRNLPASRENSEELIKMLNNHQLLPSFKNQELDSLFAFSFIKKVLEAANFQKKIHLFKSIVQFRAQKIKLESDQVQKELDCLLFSLAVQHFPLISETLTLLEKIFDREIPASLIGKEIEKCLPIVLESKKTTIVLTILKAIKDGKLAINYTLLFQELIKYDIPTYLIFGLAIVKNYIASLPPSLNTGTKVVGNYMRFLVDHLPLRLAKELAELLKRSVLKDHPICHSVREQIFVKKIKNLTSYYPDSQHLGKIHYKVLKLEKEYKELYTLSSLKSENDALYTEALFDQIMTVYKMFKDRDLIHYMDHIIAIAVCKLKSISSKDISKHLQMQNYQKFVLRMVVKYIEAIEMHPVYSSKMYNTVDSLLLHLFRSESLIEDVQSTYQILEYFLFVISNEHPNFMDHRENIETALKFIHQHNKTFFKEKYAGICAINHYLSFACNEKKYTLEMAKADFRLFIKQSAYKTLNSLEWMLTVLITLRGRILDVKPELLVQFYSLLLNMTKEMGSEEQIKGLSNIIAIFLPTKGIMWELNKLGKSNAFKMIQLLLELANSIMISHTGKMKDDFIPKNILLMMKMAVDLLDDFDGLFEENQDMLVESLSKLIPTVSRFDRNNNENLNCLSFNLIFVISNITYFTMSNKNKLFVVLKAWLKHLMELTTNSKDLNDIFSIMLCKSNNYDAFIKMVDLLHENSIGWPISRKKKVTIRTKLS